MNDASLRRISLRRKRKSCEITTEVPGEKRVSPSPDKSQNCNRHATENKQKNKMGATPKGKVSTNNSEMTMNKGEMCEVKQESPLATREDNGRNIQESTPKSRGLNNSMASTCSILSSTLMQHSPDMPFYSSQLGATQECEVVWDCNSPGFSKEDLKKMYNKDSSSPSPVAAPIPPRALFPLGRKDKDKSTKKTKSNYAAQVTAQLDALLLKISSSEKMDSRPSSEDLSMSEDDKLEVGLPCPLKEMASQPFIGEEVGNSLTEQDTQSVRNLGLTEFSEDMFAEDVALSNIPVGEKDSNSSSKDLVGEDDKFQVNLECGAEELKEWSPEDVKKKVEVKEVLKGSSNLSSDEFDDDLFNESVIKSTQALEEAFLGEMHDDDLQAVVQDVGHGKSDDLKEYVSPVVGKPRKTLAEENYVSTKGEKRSSKLSSSTNDIVERLPVHSSLSKQKGPSAQNNDISGCRYQSQLELENSDVLKNKSESENFRCGNMRSENNSDSKNHNELGIRTKNLKQINNYMGSRGDSVGHTSNIASKVNSCEEINDSYRPRSYTSGHKTTSLESRNDVSGVKCNSLVPRSYSSGSNSSKLGSQNATVLTKRDLPQYKSNSQKEIKRGGDVNKVGLPRSRSSHCIQTSTLVDFESKRLIRTNNSEHSVKLDLNDAVFAEDFDDSFFDTILSTLPENDESLASGKNALVTGMKDSGLVQKTNNKMGPTKKCNQEADISYKSKASSSVKLVGSKLNHPSSSGVSLTESFGDDDLFRDDVLNFIDQVESQYASQPPSQFKCTQDEISRKKEDAKRRREEKMKKKHAQGHYFPVC